MSVKAAYWSPSLRSGSLRPFCFSRMYLGNHAVNLTREGDGGGPEKTSDNTRAPQRFERVSPSRRHHHTTTPPHITLIHVTTPPHGLGGVKGWKLYVLQKTGCGVKGGREEEAQEPSSLLLRLLPEGGRDEKDRDDALDDELEHVVAGDRANVVGDDRTDRSESEGQAPDTCTGRWAGVRVRGHGVRVRVRVKV